MDRKMTFGVEKLGLTPYRCAYDRQMELLKRVHENQEGNVCLVTEHQPVFTIGRHGSAKNVTVSEEFLQERGIELIRIERGGEVTYHGPGQIVCYPIMNLRKIGMSVVEYVHTLEQIMLNVVSFFGIQAGRDGRNHGIWVGDRKLGSVGIAVRHGISYHGLALNVNPDLEPFSWVNPCGLTGISMSSMEHELQHQLDIKKVEPVLINEINLAFENGDKRKKSRIAKPGWLKQRLPSGSGYEKTRRLVNKGGLCTVCQEARCPNQFECFAKGTATFMLMGDNCTRNCGFCAVAHGEKKALDPDEPTRIATAVAGMGLKYAVLTSVTRDDLPDGGAEHFARTINAVRERCPETMVEVLIPDMQGSRSALECICESRPSVLNHNVETVKDLYPKVRPQAVYERSLNLLARVKEINSGIVIKSGLMLGLGETGEELLQAMWDIRATGCDLLTLGQYLQPTADNLEVHRYVPPEEFEIIRKTALAIGFSGVAAGPHVRSSYQAGELYKLCEQD